MRRLPFRFSFAGMASMGALAALVACGGISDPTQASNERVATVSGALTGTEAPSGTRVALVWKVASSSTFAVSGDVAVVNGKFTMALSTPPDSYFFAPSSEFGVLHAESGQLPGNAPPPDSTKPPAPNTSTPTPGSGSGQITAPLNAAVAGFVVYVDTNGNGKLDIAGEYASSTDEVIGGNAELLLTYLRDGGALDYEKLRDRSGILPTTGYNVAWKPGRWLPLDAVELKLGTQTKLPGLVCGEDGDDTVSETPATEPEPAPESGDENGTGGNRGYPAPNDPNLHCSEDGRSWTYEPSQPSPTDCPPPPPAPQGLCAGDEPVAETVGCGHAGAYGEELPSGLTAPPPGWPCPVAESPAPDADAGL